jgi:hypothetical protein
MADVRELPAWVEPGPSGEVNNLPRVARFVLRGVPVDRGLVTKEDLVISIGSPVSHYRVLVALLVVPRNGASGHTCHLDAVR